MTVYALGKFGYLVIPESNAIWAHLIYHEPVPAHQTRIYIAHRCVALNVVIEETQMLISTRGGSSTGEVRPAVG